MLGLGLNLNKTKKNGGGGGGEYQVWDGYNSVAISVYDYPYQTIMESNSHYSLYASVAPIVWTDRPYFNDEYKWIGYSNANDDWQQTGDIPPVDYIRDGGGTPGTPLGTNNTLIESNHNIYYQV